MLETTGSPHRDRDRDFEHHVFGRTRKGKVGREAKETHAHCTCWSVVLALADRNNRDTRHTFWVDFFHNPTTDGARHLSLPTSTTVSRVANGQTNSIAFSAKKTVVTFHASVVDELSR